MKKYLLIFLSILMIFPAPIYAEEKEETNNEVVENSETEVKEEDSNTLIVTLEDCVDGDTARFRTANDEVIKARFLAIDTPETVHPTTGEEPFGKTASEYTCESLTNAEEIKLEYDANSDEEDNYGRKLVWVFVDETLLQNSLVSKGYAEVAYLYGDYKYTATLEESEKQAKASKLGIWSEENTTNETEEEKEETKEENTSDSFINKIVDKLFAKILEYIDDLLEKLLNSIEEML